MANSVTKTRLLKLITERLGDGVSKEQVAAVFDALVVEIIELTADGEEIHLNELGSFEVKAIKELSEMGPSAVGFEADISFLRARHGSGGRRGGYGVSSSRRYNSGHSSSGYRYGGQRWPRGAPSWGVEGGVGSGIDPDTMDAVNARIRGLKAATVKANATPACHTLGCGSNK